MRLGSSQIYPLVRDLAPAEAPVRVPVAVTCGVLGFSPQPYYGWLARPVTDTELGQAYVGSAVFDAHRNNPEFGYRFLADQVRPAGHSSGARTVCGDLLDQRLVEHLRHERTPWLEKSDLRCRPRAIWSRREFTTAGPNQLWLTDPRDPRRHSDHHRQVHEPGRRGASVSSCYQTCISPDMSW